MWIATIVIVTLGVVSLARFLHSRPTVRDLSNYVPLEAFAGLSIESVDLNDLQAFPEYMWTLAFAEFEPGLLKMFGFHSLDDAETEFVTNALEEQLGEAFKFGYQTEVLGRESDRHDTTIVVQRDLRRAYVMVLRH